MFRYLAFGLDVRSNVPIPGLNRSRRRLAGRATLSVTLGALPHPADSSGRLLFAEPIEEGGAAALVVEEEKEGRVRFAYTDGTRFVIRSDGGAVWCDWPPPLTVEDAATYLLGPVMTFVLKLRGRLSLHASVFTLDGAEAVAVAGGPETGKSTLLGALVMRGARALSDDVAPVEEAGGRFLVHPTYPRVRLWDDSVERLFGSPDALPLLTPNWEKRYLDVLRRGSFEDRPLPLGALFVLDRRSDSAEAPLARPLTSREGFLAILGHLHSVWMLPRNPQDEVFGLATRLAAQVPVLSLIPHRDPSRLPELCAVVERARTRSGADVSAG